MSKLKTGDNQKRHYQSYSIENRAKKNKKAKLKRHLRNFPNDATAQEALEDLATNEYVGRKAPLAWKRPWGSAAKRTYARLLKAAGQMDVNTHHHLKRADMFGQGLCDIAFMPKRRYGSKVIGLDTHAARRIREEVEK